MALPFDRIEAEALALAPHERARLAHRLILSLDGDEDDPTDAELAWETEIGRRLDEYRRGEVRAIPSAEVFAKARSLLK